MVEIIKDIVIDFILFSGIEGFILLLFCNKVFDYKKFTFIQWLIFSFTNCIITVLFPPIIKQLIGILWISLFLYLFKSNKEKYLKCLLAGFFSMAMLIVIEVIYEIILNKLTNFEAFNLFLSDADNFKLFILTIPLRIVEIINILMIGVTKNEVCNRWRSTQVIK